MHTKTNMYKIRWRPGEQLNFFPAQKINCKSVCKNTMALNSK